MSSRDGFCTFLQFYPQAHVHFLRADAFSFGDQVQLQSGDIMDIWWKRLGRALQNTLKISKEKEIMIEIKLVY